MEEKCYHHKTSRETVHLKWSKWSGEVNPVWIRTKWVPTIEMEADRMEQNKLIHKEPVQEWGKHIISCGWLTSNHKLTSIKLIHHFSPAISNHQQYGIGFIQVLSKFFDLGIKLWNGEKNSWLDSRNVHNWTN